MSIPPLVCSTPPPPDQCEEDKDPDDYDISYNLSQDDDDDGEFEYRNFATYSHYESNSGVKKKEYICNNTDALATCETTAVIENQKQNMTNNEQQNCETNIINELKLKCEEDTNIEDLGLEINNKSISNRSDDKEEDIENYDENSIKVTIKISKSAPDHNISNPPSPSEGNTVELSNGTHCNYNCKTEDEHNQEPLDSNVVSSDPNSITVGLNIENTIEKSPLSVTDSNLDDDFGDFDDFQYVGTGREHTIIDCDNPWDSNEVSEGDTFGNFTADFDTINSNTVSILPNEEPLQSICIDSTTANTALSNEDDDFGDFDDFQSTTIKNSSKEVPDEIEYNQQNIPELDLNSSDNEQQVIEHITKVLTSIFETEILEPENAFEDKLESALSETWRHLKETDIRQPYIINWNNSLGQKTLLRALCIDSRNILFGPKWGYNMPKYAVTLSAAPLQPQKPLAPPNPSQGEVAAVDKTSTKTSGWTDPFAADGHESCNTENESVVELTPSNLDVFDVAISTKSDKIFSSTLNVQPLRQINLPDTHIFTPTDSETPRSKTIHYDSGPPILLPQPVIENNKAVVSISENMDNTAKSVQDDDYWEFQDFKSSTSNNSPPASNELHGQTPEPKTDNVVKSNENYQIQVLEPIKMEPLFPTVNWPDPGEIKETFDDFSDFVSNSSWNDKPQLQTSHESGTSPIETNTPAETTVLDKINDKHKPADSVRDNMKTNSTDDFDDDFDTFQSALPPKHITPEINFNSLESTFNNIPQQKSSISANFDNAFSNMDSIKSNVISTKDSKRPNEALTPNLGYSTNSMEFSTKKVSVGNHISNLLQPTIPISNASSQSSQQKSGQILQPLSLESYSQINWPNPGIDLQDLSRFNPVETLQSLKSDLSVGGQSQSKSASPVHSQKNANHQTTDDDWGEFVSSKPKQSTLTKKQATFADDDEWTDFVSSSSVKPQNGLNTISLNVHTNSNIQKSNNTNKFPTNSQLPLDIPTLNYITPKSTGHKSYNDRHFQNL